MVKLIVQLQELAELSVRLQRLVGLGVLLRELAELNILLENPNRRSGITTRRCWSRTHRCAAGAG